MASLLSLSKETIHQVGYLSVVALYFTSRALLLCCGISWNGIPKGGSSISKANTCCGFILDIILYLETLAQAIQNLMLIEVAKCQN